MEEVTVLAAAKSTPLSGRHDTVQLKVIWTPVNLKIVFIFLLFLVASSC
jgi:hypothetical protein